MLSLARATPSSIEKSREQPLHEILAAVCMNIVASKTLPQRIEILRQMQAFIEENDVSRRDFIGSLAMATEGRQAEWVSFFNKFETSPQGFKVLPDSGSESNRLPDTSRSPADAAENYELSTSIIREAATASTSIIIVGPSRCGKSSAQRAIAGETIASHPNAEFLFLDLQTTKFLGLQRSSTVHTLPVLECNEEGSFPVVNHVPNTVTQVTSGEASHMLLATEVIKRAWNVYRGRSQKRQEAVRSGPEVPQFHPFRFFVNEWNIFYDWANSYTQSKADRSKFAKEARARGIIDPLYPLDAITLIKYIISSGGDLNISCCIVGQEYTKESTGLPPQMQANATTIAVGRIDPETKMGGYSSVSALVCDPYRVRDPDTRKVLGAVVRSCIKENKPILLSTLGFCSVGLLPDYQYLETASILNRYQYEVI